jgi:TRAP-type C4-dicarboxylate transport system permease small subunit
MTDQRPAPEEKNQQVAEPENSDPNDSFKFRDYAVEDYLVLIIFWVLAGVVFAQFFSRYVLNSSITWTEEIARYLLICVGFAGSIMAVRKNSHIFVEVCYRFMPRRLAMIAARMVDLIKIVFFGIGTWLCWKIIPIMANHRMVSINLPMAWIYKVVFISFLVMTLRSIYLAYRHFKYHYVPLAGFSDK